VAAPLTQGARDRLREQVRREKELASRVVMAESRLADAIAKRAAVLSAQDEILDRRRDDVADALIAYLNDAGVGLDRAAIIFGRSRSELARIVRERRVATRNRAADPS
jgi:hypothetical protein